jgi:hypothetical protein
MESSVSRAELAAVALLCVCILLTLSLVTGRTPAHDGCGHDGIHYAAMADAQTDPTIASPPAPYCYRVLTPLLASWMPGKGVQRFALLNFLTWWAALTAWYVLARRTGLDQSLATLGTLVLATCAWGPMNGFYNPCYVDPLMHLFIILGLILMLSGSAWPAVLIPLSMLQREQTAVVLWVCSVVLDVHRSGWSRRGLARHGLILAACAAVFVGLRLVVQPGEGTQTSLWQTATQVARWWIDDPMYIVLTGLAILYSLSVPLIGVALLPGARRYIKTQRWPEYFLALSVLSLLGGSDKGRLIFLAQPVIILACLHGLRSLPETRRPLIALAGLLIVHLFVQFQPSMMVVDGKLVAPLVDDPDRGTHAASWVLGSYWPVHMSDVAAHVLSSLGLAGMLLWWMRRESASHTLRAGLPRQYEKC